MIKSKVKKLLPQSTKLKGKLAIRYWKDLFDGNHVKFAGASNNTKGYKEIFKVEQPILDSKVLKSKANKVHNIAHGALAVEQVEIAPGEIFSFWKALGRPSKKNGYKEGINIIEGKIKEDYGGGLCQLASLVYHTGLQAGLEMIERYNHSVDLYKNETRYTPLGSDAAVFYGYKDLRMKNNLPHPIRFKFHVENDLIICSFLSTNEIKPQEIIFEIIKEEENYEEVLTKKVIGDKKETIAVSTYKL